MAAIKGANVVLSCRHCKAEQAMKPHSEGMKGQIIWLRCAGCNKATFLKMADYQQLVAARKAPRVIADGECVKYDPNQNFMIGQRLYHPIWDDRGEVLRKLTTSEGESTIVVSFNRLGERTLVEARQA
jgi:hypothetical protein